MEFGLELLPATFGDPGAAANFLGHRDWRQHTLHGPWAASPPLFIFPSSSFAIPWLWLHASSTSMRWLQVSSCAVCWTIVHEHPTSAHRQESTCLAASACNNLSTFRLRQRDACQDAKHRVRYQSSSCLPMACSNAVCRDRCEFNVLFGLDVLVLRNFSVKEL